MRCTALIMHGSRAEIGPAARAAARTTRRDACSLVWSNTAPTRRIYAACALRFVDRYPAC